MSAVAPHGTRSAFHSGGYINASEGPDVQLHRTLQVPEAHVTHVVARTLEPGMVAVTVKGSPAAAGLPVSVSVLVNGTVVASGTGVVASDSRHVALDRTHVASRNGEKQRTDSEAVASSGSALVESLDEGSMGQGSIQLNISDFRMWSPDDPFLYDLDVVLPGACPSPNRCSPSLRIRKGSPRVTHPSKIWTLSFQVLTTPF